MGVKGPDPVLHLRPIATAAAALLLFSLAPLTCLAAYTPPDNYLIDCGSTTNTTVNGRTFSADIPPASWTLSAPQSLLANTTTSILSVDSAALYSTVRVFPSASSYSFPIKQKGRHFIRLYFFPLPQSSRNLTSAEFSVATQAYTLLSSYRAAAAASSGAVVFKEYSVNVTSNTLVLSFTPAANSMAFVNAIEVFSVPDSLISGSPKALATVGVFEGLQGTALETVHRINMGGPLVSPFNDSLWRAWIPDGPFLLNGNLAKNFTSTMKINYIQGGATVETAPPTVYSSLTMMSVSMVANANFNVTWDFPVDPGSAYLVRLHFCDIVSNALNQLLFNVYVGNMSAANLDLSFATNQNLAAPYFLDVVAGDALVKSGKLRVSIGPDALANVEPNAILNGLEIMKMNASGGTFDAQPAGGKKRKTVAAVIGAVIGGAAVAGVLATAVIVVLRRRRKMALEAEKKRQQLQQQRGTSNWAPLSASAVASSTAFHTYATGYTNRTTGGPTSRVASTLHTDLVGLRFPFVVLQEATANFDEARVIGLGGFGKVYSGALADGTRVAVKRGNPKSQQGLREFRTEIDLLSRLRHRHLVSLIGYCDEHNEMVLVYEFMEQGTLKCHLYGDPSPPPLSWKQRLEICIGAARGLHYLHTGQAKAIIHRDVKSANILLDEHLHAKVADFGLSKTGPELDQTHVSTAVKGSFGYLDPEYFRRQQLTEKSDVYSFGVVLYEVVCARPVIDPTRPRDMVNLAEWAVRLQKQGKLEQIVDPTIAGTIRPESLQKFSTTAEKCLAECGVDRPSMGDVLWNLEYALQLQEAMSVAIERSGEESSSGNEVPLLLSSRFRGVGRSAELGLGSVVAERGSNTEGEQEQDELGSETMSKVFSELVRSDGK